MQPLPVNEKPASEQRPALPAALAPRASPDGRPVVLAGLLGLLLLATHQSTLVWLVGRWNDSEGYYGHGPLVPLISAVIAWRSRERLVPRPDRAGLLLGLAVVVLALGVHLVGAVADMGFLRGVSLFGSLVGFTLVLGGLRFTRELAFPLGFLAFAVPVPMMWIAKISVQLKLLASQVAIHALGAAGVAAVRDGSTIHLANGSVEVEDVCSGLRSLISLLAMGVLLAGVEPRLSFAGRATMTALAIPVALVANAIRVAALCLGVVFIGPRVVDSWAHEASGFVLFSSALLLLMSARAALIRPAAPLRPAPSGPAIAPGSARFALCAALLVPGALASWWFERPARTDLPPIARGIPLVVGEWKADEFPVDPKVTKILESEDVVLRRYAKPGRHMVAFTSAASRGDRRVAHPPEVCFSGTGWIVDEERLVPLADGVTARSIVLSHGEQRELVVYFYAAGHELGPDFTRLQWSIVRQRFSNPDVASALVRFSVRVGGASGVTREQALESMRDLAASLIPAVRARLSLTGPEEAR